MRNQFGGITTNKRWVLLPSLLLMLLSMTVDSMAEERVAFIIGNDNYQAHSQLKNAVSDAKRIGDLLERELGFRVIRKNDVKHSQWLDILDEIGKSAVKADWIVVYYAGHGIQFQGKNYLIPVDLDPKGESDLRRAGQLDELLAEVSRSQKMGLVILDACRNNPFTAQLNQSAGRSVAGRGLARVSNTGTNTLVAFATQEDNIAEDSGVYADVLVKYLAMPGLSVEKLFGKVRDEVMERTGNVQKPFTYGSLGGGDYAFKPGPVQKGDPDLNSWSDYFQGHLLQILEGIMGSFYKWIFTVAGVVISFITLGFFMMHRYVRTTNQGQLRPRDVSQIIHEKLSNLSRSLWPKPVPQPLQHPPEPQPQLPPQPQPFVDNSPPKPSAIYRLVPQTNDGRLQPLELTGPGNYRLGRAPARNIQLVVPSQYVSSEHLIINVNPDYSIAIENLNPTNKTHVAGVELLPGHIVLIQPGQTLRLGHDEVIYRLEKGIRQAK